MVDYQWFTSSARTVILIAVAGALLFKMPTQTLVPVSASGAWSSPSSVLTIDQVVTSTSGTNAPGSGIAINMGTVTSGGEAVSVALTQAWTQANTSPKALLYAWLSPDGASKIGTPTPISLPFAPYMPGNTVNQIGATQLSGTLSSVQAAAGIFIIIEQQAGGAPPNFTNVDYVEGIASWGAASPVLCGGNAIRNVPPFAFGVGLR